MHTPVLLNEVLEMLAPKPGENFIDATVNGGGHAKAIFEKVAPDGRVMGMDWDNDVIEKLRAENLPNLVVVNASYTTLTRAAAENDFTEVNGVLFDLGMSNWHIEESGRGFSFMRDEPLDMRFDKAEGISAAEFVGQSSEADLERIISEYGEERFAPAIARAIIQSRQKEPIERTGQLVEIIKQAVPSWYLRQRTHCATKTFQAVRIAVNHEFENIENGIDQAIELVVTGGRVAVITFHSLEDRLVKNIFKKKVAEGSVSLINKKAIKPSWTEVVSNRKARSAKLRVVCKL